MKKITYIINSFEIGGTEKQLLELINLIKNKYEISIFSFSDGTLYNDFLKLKINIKVNKIFGFGLLSLIFFLIKNKTDIYHFFLPKSYILGGVLTFFSKKKKIMSRRSLNNYHKKYFYISVLFEKILHKKMDLILVNSSAIKKELVNDENVNKSKIKIIPNFNLLKKKKIVRDYKLSIKKTIIFGFVANFIPYKGHMKLIKLCSKLDVKKSWKLMLIGFSENKHGKKIKELIKGLGLQKKIKILKSTKNIDFFYKRLDFSVCASSEEGSSNFLLESISCGLPIIAFDVGGNRDFFSNNGFLIPQNNEEKFKKSLEFLINSKSLKIYKENSIKLSKKKFDNKMSLKKYLKVYNIFFK